MGGWVYPTQNTATKAFFAISAPTTPAQTMMIGQNSTGGFDLSSYDSVNFNDQGFGTCTPNVWYYIVARWINSTNKRASVYSSATGAITAGSDPGTFGATDPQSCSVRGIGTLGATAIWTASTNFEGLLGEYFITNTDIQADGLATQAALGAPARVPRAVLDPEHREGHSGLSKPARLDS
jgi:hypothetical protein